MCEANVLFDGSALQEVALEDDAEIADTYEPMGCNEVAVVKFFTSSRVACRRRPSLAVPAPFVVSGLPLADQLSTGWPQAPSRFATLSLR